MSPQTPHPDDPMRGQLVDDQGRCKHHYGPTDVVCFRFPDAGWKFWACHACYRDENGKPTRLWSKDESKELAVQCGVCRSILGLGFYWDRSDAGIHACPHCDAPWNPNCRKHRRHYIDY